MPTTIRIPDELRDAIDAARGDVPRERWVRRACERALAEPAVSRVARVEASGAQSLHGTVSGERRLGPTAHGSPSPSLDRFKES